LFKHITARNNKVNDINNLHSNSPLKVVDHPAER